MVSLVKLVFKTRSSDVYSMVQFIEEQIGKVLIFYYVQIVQLFFWLVGIFLLTDLIFLHLREQFILPHSEWRMIPSKFWNTLKIWNPINHPFRIHKCSIRQLNPATVLPHHIGQWCMSSMIPYNRSTICCFYLKLTFVI